MVIVQILDQEAGHNQQELAPPEALEQLSQFSDEQRWLFVDGDAKNFSTLNLSDVQEASVIKVTEQLQEA